jgi:hydantoinase/carbamoylase family amidase
MVSSSVWAGLLPLETAHNLREVGVGTATMKSELERIGYLGSVPATHKSIPMAAHFELHIEQGPILEAESRNIGIVQGAQAYRWFTIEVTGQESHTGTTPLFARSDALLAAAKMILHSHRTATRLGALASTGIISAEPGSTNTIPGTVRFSLDIRAPADITVDALEVELKTSFAAIARGDDVGGLNTDGTPSKSCTVSFRADSVSPAVDFHPDCIQCVSDSARALFGSGFDSLAKEMRSGAGHDSVQTSYVCPSSMIFVPCRDGISHNPTEFAAPENCAIGAQVLMGAVLRFDQMRTERDWK